MRNIVPTDCYLLLLLIQTELLIQAQLTRESASLSPSLHADFRRVLELAPRLLEELMKVILIILILHSSSRFSASLLLCWTIA